jgi:hypothetical protein
MLAAPAERAWLRRGMLMIWVCDTCGHRVAHAKKNGPRPGQYVHAREQAGRHALMHSGPWSPEMPDEEDMNDLDRQQPRLPL